MRIVGLLPFAVMLSFAGDKPPEVFACAGSLCLTDVKWDVGYGGLQSITGVLDNRSEIRIDTLTVNFALLWRGDLVGSALAFAPAPIDPKTRWRFRATVTAERASAYCDRAEIRGVATLPDGKQQGYIESFDFRPVWNPREGWERRKWEPQYRPPQKASKPSSGPTIQEHPKPEDWEP